MKQINNFIQEKLIINSQSKPVIIDEDFLLNLFDEYNGKPWEDFKDKITKLGFEDISDKCQEDTEFFYWNNVQSIGIHGWTGGYYEYFNKTQVDIIKNKGDVNIYT